MLIHIGGLQGQKYEVHSSVIYTFLRLNFGPVMNQLAGLLSGGEKDQCKLCHSEDYKQAGQWGEFAELA